MIVRPLPLRFLHPLSADLAKLRHRRNRLTTPAPPKKNSGYSISLRERRRKQPDQEFTESLSADFRPASVRRVYSIELAVGFDRVKGAVGAEKEARLRKLSTSDSTPAAA